MRLPAFSTPGGAKPPKATRPRYGAPLVIDDPVDRPPAVPYGPARPDRAGCPRQERGHGGVVPNPLGSLGQERAELHAPAALRDQDRGRLALDHLRRVPEGRRPLSERPR